MTENVKALIFKTDNKREFMMKVKDYSQLNIDNKSIVRSLMSELTIKKFDWLQPIHNHLTGQMNLVEKLKSLDMDVSESFLLQFIRNSLSSQFGYFQVNYKTIKK